MFGKIKTWLLGKPKTSGYKPVPHGAWFQTPRDLPLFTFQTIRAMLWDPTIRLGLAMRDAPLYGVEFAYKEGGGDKTWTPGVKADNPAVSEFVDQQIQRIWKHDLYKILRNQVWGWSAGEVTYRLSAGGRIEYDALLDRHAADTRALTKRGSLSGVRFLRVGRTGGGHVDLGKPKACWFTYNPESGLHYGGSALLGPYSAWCDKWLDGGALDVRRLFMHKDAYGGSEMYYPDGKTLSPDSNGDLREIPNRDIAQQIVEQAKAGAVRTLPSVRDANGQLLWEWKEARVAASPTHILEYPKDLDVEMLRGLEIPDDVITSEATGAWAGKAVPAQAFYAGCDRRLTQIVGDVTRQVLEPLVLLNFGRAEEFEVCTKPLAEQTGEQQGGKGDGGHGADGGGFNPFMPRYGQQQMALDAERAVGEGVLSAGELVRAAKLAMNGRAQRLAQVHAPHNMTIAGKEFRGGEFIPGEYLGRATPRQKAEIQAVAKPKPKESQSIKIKPTQQRAFTGEPVPVKTKISKQEAGKIGEAVIISFLRLNGMADARHMNLDRNNFPVDLIQDHETIEVKTGLVSNGKDAQKWRLTIGEPGKEEKAWLATATPEQKSEWNAVKQHKIHERKASVLKSIGKELGHPIKASTMTVVLNPDTRTADIYKFSGWHDIIRWNSDQAKSGYMGSVRYG